MTLKSFIKVPQKKENVMDWTSFAASALTILTGVVIIGLVVWIAYRLIKKLITFTIAEKYRIEKQNQEQKRRE